MGGSIDFESRLNHGSTFIITIPFKIGEASARSPLPEKNSLKGFNLLRHSILLVEDYPATQQIITEFLERAQAVVTIADDGSRALETWDKKSFDLILMDLQLPGIDGYELTRRIRQTPKGKTIPIIGITANALSDVEKECEKAGIDTVLIKPLRKNELLCTVAQFLGISVSEKPDKKQLPLEGLEEDTIREIINGFIEQSSLQLERMEKAVEKNDFLTLHRDSHAMKGGALTLQEEEIAGLAKKIEERARLRNMEGLSEHISRLRHAFAAFTEKNSITSDGGRA